MKTVGGDAFINYHILNHYFKNFEKIAKYLKWSDRQKKHKPSG